MNAEEYKQATSIYNTVDHGDTEVAFVYVPKTGGSYLSINYIPSIYKEGYRLSKLPSSHHMSVSRVREIVSPSTPLFTMVRDPYDRACSEYYFIKRKIDASIHHLKWNFTDPRKLEFLGKRAEVIMGTPIFADKLYFILRDSFTVEDYLEWSTDHLTYPSYYDSATPKDFDIVGVTESMSQSIELLNKMYGMSAGGGDNNENADKEIGRPYVTNYPRAEFEKKNPIEYEMYYEGKKKFAELSKIYL